MSEMVEKIRGLPRTPGVYVMKDGEGAIIYVGKAVSLRNRVSTYFSSRMRLAGTPYGDKVEAMMAAVKDFEYIVTRTEMDALLLESNLVKKHKPRYNILLKDDKAAPYIRVCMRDEYPSFSVVRRLKKDGAKYFGPFFAGISAGALMGILQACFRVKICNIPSPKNNFAKKDMRKKAETANAAHRASKGKKARACLNYHINLCMGVCAGEADRDEYMSAVRSAVDFLQGKDEGAAELISERMNKAAELERFESAIMYREQLDMLKKLGERTVASLDRFVDLDCIAAAIDEENGLSAVSVLVVRAGKMIGLRNFAPDGVPRGEGDLAAQFIRQYYTGDTVIPPEICVAAIEDRDLTEEFLQNLTGKRVHITMPKIGAKNKLLETAALNAKEFLAKNADLIKRRSQMTEEAVDKLQAALALLRRPTRMECYDISHISGTDQVAAMVVFRNGVPDKSQYRKFKIRTVSGADDYAAMREVLTRRLRRLQAESLMDDEEKSAATFADTPLHSECGTGDFAKRQLDGNNHLLKFADAPPDLIVIDGGKGQLSAAMETLGGLGADIPVIALAERAEEIFVPHSPDPIRLPLSAPELKLLIRLRDETHRFAVTYHRKLRAKTYSTELTKIKGVGPQKAKALLEKFSYNEIKAASAAALAAIDGINEALAEKIAEYFRTCNT